MFRRATGFKQALIAAAFGAFSSIAAAAQIGDTFDGNDCAGVFGANFGDCAIPASIDEDETPIIVKFEFSDAGAVTATSINDALFPTIDGNEFDFDFGAGGTGTGTWTYTPGDGDPLINYFVAKGGNFFNLFSNDGDPNTDDWFTPTNPANDRLFGLSHLSFYDTARDEGPGKVPEPTTMLLLGAGLLAVGIARRRAKRD